MSPVRQWLTLGSTLTQQNGLRTAAQPVSTSLEKHVGFAERVSGGGVPGHDNKPATWREMKRRKKRRFGKKGMRTEVGLPLAYFSVLFSNPLSSSSPFAALSSPTLSLSLPIFYSIHPCSAGASLHEHGVCVCVCV